MENNLKAAPLKQALFMRLEELLQSEGFVLRAKDNSFVREHGDVTEAFLVTCTDAKPGYWVEPGVALRYESVEKIFHQTSGWAPKSQKGTFTVGTRIGCLIDGKASSCRLLLETDSETPAIAKKLEAIFNDFARRYFARFGSLAAVDAELNGNPTERSIHRAGAWLKCSTGLIVAKLVGRPDFEQLEAIYTDLMRKDNKGFYFLRFRALAESLKHIGVSSMETDAQSK